MELQVFEGSFERAWSEWEALLPQSWLNTIFLTPLWQHLWWKELGGTATLLLLCFREGERLVGVAPLMEGADGVTFLGDTDLWDYHDFVVARGYEEAFYLALVAHARESGWRQMDLRSIPGNSPTLERLPMLARDAGYTVTVAQEDVSPGVALPRTWEDYLAGLSKKDRHELRRKFRRLEGAGPYRWYSWDGATPVETGLEQFFSLMRESRQDKAIFLNPEREGFFRRVVRELAPLGLVKLCFLEFDGQRVASALCFDHASRRLLYNSGYDPRYAALSVGLLMKALCLREAIELGMSYFDFLRGNEPYKSDLGAKDVTLYRLVMQR